ncbi:uncharacterized protein [Pagrus major]|uniref:uncharacterized protein n=1 Tax=Pagrus major TaxID=143350 RepID=UPI003CC87454
MAEAAGPLTGGAGVDTKPDEKLSTKFNKAATIEAVEELLLETLSDLSYEEQKSFTWFLQFTFFQRSLPQIPWSRLQDEDVAESLVDVMLETCGQKSVEVTREVLMDMNQTDLVQRLSETSSGPKAAAGSSAEVFGVNTTEKEKHSVDEDWPALIQKVESMESVIELLLETLKDLSDAELKMFKGALSRQPEFHRHFFSTPLKRRLPIAHVQHTVFSMVQICGQKCVEKTNEILKTMKRTDLVQRLSDSSSGSKKKHSADEHRSALIHKVATIAAVQQLLLETLNDLSDMELKKFKKILRSIVSQKNLPDISWALTFAADRADIVNQMVEIYGQQSVELTREVFMDMKMTDLVQRLSKPSSGLKEKHSVGKHPPASSERAATMGAVQELLLETLSDLSYEEQKTFILFLQFTFFQRSLPQIPLSRLQKGNMTESLVDVMVETCGQKSVEVTREVLMDMNQTDLVQRLSETSSGPKAAAGSSAEVFGVNTTEKEKHSVDEDWPALIQKVESMESVIELLLETLKDLSDAELGKFKYTLLIQIDYIKHFPYNTLMLRSQTRHVQDTVFIIVLNYSQQSVKKTKDILKTVKRTDLVQRLSDSSSGSKKKHSADEHRSALIHKVATIAAVQQLLLETLNNLSDTELKIFKKILQSIVSQKNLPDISWVFSFAADRAVTVNQMVQTYGQQSVELTREVFMDMKRTDLVQRLSKPSTGLKEKHSVGKHPPASSEREVTMTSLQEKLLETLEDFSPGDLEKFKHVLLNTEMKEGQEIPRHRLETADRVQTVELMVELYGQQSEEVIREVFNKMNRRDLVQRLSDISLGSEGPSRSLEHEDCGSAMQDSSDWTKLEPEVNSTDADEAPTYSLQSEAGNFECSVSGLRWVCKEKVSFKYQFCPWEEPMERMESMKYRLAGPLIDITVHAGKLDVVYLPHWICIDDNPEIRDKFAVLHIDDCGDVVEKVAEVTSSHVKLSEPVFSPRAVLMKFGVPVKINCKVLMYKTNTAFLTLHVYLIPRDPGLQQAIDRRQLSSGYKAIQKPHPEKSLKMRDRFILTADLDGAEIYPEKLKLRYESREPNFFEVYIENPDRKFSLKLTKENEHQPVWTCALRKDEYQSSAHIQGEHFLDKHQCDLIARVSNIGPILDNLQKEGVIQQEDYDTIRTIPTTQERMRKLYSGPLKAGGQAAKDIFFQILKEKESHLVADLKMKES